MAWRCFDLLYASRLLSDGYGLSREDAVVEFYGEIDGMEVEWTLGALHSYLAEMNSRRGDSPLPGAEGSNRAPSHSPAAAGFNGYTSSAILVIFLAAGLLLAVFGYHLSRNSSRLSLSTYEEVNRRA